MNADKSRISQTFIHNKYGIISCYVFFGEPKTRIILNKCKTILLYSDDYCGGCNARWYLNKNIYRIEVTKFCDRRY